MSKHEVKQSIVGLLKDFWPVLCRDAWLLDALDEFIKSRVHLVSPKELNVLRNSASYGVINYDLALSLVALGKKTDACDFIQKVTGCDRYQATDVVNILNTLV